MKKKLIKCTGFLCLSKLWKIMRLSIFFLILIVTRTWATDSYSQVTRLSIQMNDSKVMDVLGEIEDKTEFFFLINQKLVDLERRVTINVRNQKIEEVLSELFAGTNVNFMVLNRQIVLTTALPAFQPQPGRVTGRVIEINGQPLPGVSVIVKGTTIGSISDINGNYRIDVPPQGKILVFSFMGMRSQEVDITDKTIVDIVLEEDVYGIEEVVAIGYGSMRKMNLTGATSYVNFTQLESRPASNTATLLQGQMSGVTVSNFNTQPGNDNPEIRVRGIGTFNAGQNPLIIVDGVESSLTQIPSADIESVSVLKDAASAAIYGVRAANGVILVTTKRGSIKKPTITIKQNSALQQVFAVPDMVDSWDYAMIINMDRATKGQSPLYTDEMIQKMRDGSDTDNFANTDWVEEMYRIAPMNTTYMSVDGGNESVKYLFSGEYFDQKGVLINTDTKRYSFRSNIDVNVSDNIKVGMDMSGHTRRINETLNSANESDGNSSIFYRMRRSSNPLVPVRYQNGHWGTINGVFSQTNSTMLNPVYRSQIGDFFTDRYFYQGRFFADIQLINNLKYRLNLAGVYNSSNMTRFQPTEKYFKPDGSILSENTQNTLDNSNDKDYKYVIENLLTYELNRNNHNFLFLAGQSAQYYKYDYMWASVKGLPNDLIHVLGAGVSEKNVNGNANEVTLQSFFGRANYNLLDKYLFEFNIRYDGSSRMPEDTRYGLFPSFSAGWIISNESFLRDSDLLSFLKLRGSWGQLGNQEIGEYAYVQNINLGQNYIFGDVLTAGAALTSLANDKLKWETTTILDIGVDFNFFNNRLQFVVDWFDKTSSDILVTIPIAQILGNVSPPYQNIAQVRNKGFETDVKYNGNINDFRYFAGLNFSVIDNEILDIAGITSWTSNGSRHINLENYPIGSYYGLIADGYFQSEEEILNSPAQFGGLARGDIKYKDISGPDGVPDGKVDETYDRTVIGNPFPKISYAFSLGGSFKGFDLYGFFQGVNGIDRYFWYNNESAGNFTKAVLNYWTEDNRNADYPRFFNQTNNNKNSTFWLKDASYLRLKNLELGYTFAPNVMRRIGAENLRLYLSGTNLISFTKIVDFDPEIIATDERGRIYPQAKVYSLGLNVNF